MKYEGLLTNSQKVAGFFVTQDEGFIFVWHRRNGNPDCIAIFLYEDVRLKEIRDAVNSNLSSPSGVEE